MKWYVDPINGDNSNSGHSITSPLKDLSNFEYKGVSEPVLHHGDKIFIKRGTTLQCKNVKLYANNFELQRHDYVYVGAYGFGDDPILTHHKILERKNLAKYVDNIYYVDLTIDGITSGFEGTGSNIGFIYDAKKDVIYGNRLFELGELNEFMDFYIADDKLYIYAEALESIPVEMILPLGNPIMSCDANTIYENLHFTLGGSHGLATTQDGNYNIIVQNCKFDKLGGSKLSGVTRYGNGFEIFGDGYDIQVQNCIFEDIYDTGVTYQGTNVTFENCSFNNNLFKRCYQACENWCNNPEKGKGYINCTFNNNICLLSGYGFGGKGRESGYHFILSNTNCENTDITIKNNIFFKAKNGCYETIDLTNKDLKFSNNKIYLYDDQLINKNYAQTITQFEEYINATGEDASSKFIVLESKYKDNVVEQLLLASDLFMSGLNHIYSNNTNDYQKQNNVISKLELTTNYLENVTSKSITIIDNQMIVNLKARVRAEIPAYTTYAFCKNVKGFAITQQYIDEAKQHYINLADNQIYLQSSVSVPVGTNINLTGVITLDEA